MSAKEGKGRNKDPKEKPVQVRWGRKGGRHRQERGNAGTKGNQKKQRSSEGDD